MKKYKSALYAAAVVVVATASTACQRGYGCPTDLSVAADVAAAALDAAAATQPGPAR